MGTVGTRSCAALFVLVAVVAQGCDGQACTNVGGVNGVGVEIPRALFVTSGTVTVEVCDAAGCAWGRQRLGPVPGGPAGRGAIVSFEDLGRRFEAGPATVRVEVSDGDGETVAAARRDIELSRTYPNGKACDGDGYVTGSLKLDPRDRADAIRSPAASRHRG